MKRYQGHRKHQEQDVLPGIESETRRPRRAREPRYRRDLSSAGPIAGHMPLFDAETGAEIMNVVDEGANITIYVENMDPDGHPQELLPQQIPRGDYLKMLRTQPRLTRKRSAAA